MNRMAENYFHRFLTSFLLLFIVITTWADNGDILGRNIELTKNKGTIYEMLKHVSDKSGYLFIYDSQIINNNKTIKIRKGKYTIREAIYLIAGNKDLKIDVLGKHILLRQSEVKVIVNKPIEIADSIEQNYFTLKGSIYDRLLDEPVIYSSISVNNTTIGTISNLNGEFQLTLPDSLLKSTLKFSHIGYASQEIEASFLAGQDIRLYLEPQTIPLQEVVVEVIDPLEVLDKMIEHRPHNYSVNPVNITAFYREGVEHKKNNVNLTEGILELYKTGYEVDVKHDQARLIKMRRIVRKQERDTILPKMKAGIHSCLLLDIVKNLPDFLQTNNTSSLYNYTHTDINTIDGRLVNVISFEQKTHTKDILYEGQLFIDAQNYALVEAHFEIPQKQAHKVSHMYIAKKTSGINITLQHAKYIVTYRPSSEGVYYINHIRVDLQFKVKTKKQLLGSSNLHMWIDMVNCKTDTENVKSFSRNERISSDRIFSETKYVYEPDFWGNFNVMIPEDKLREFILNNLNEIIEDKDFRY